jgi:hypothetical protein
VYGAGTTIGKPYDVYFADLVFLIHAASAAYIFAVRQTGWRSVVSVREYVLVSLNHRAYLLAGTGTPFRK